jgi:hypothetical protein
MDGEDLYLLSHAASLVTARREKTLTLSGEEK